MKPLCIITGGTSGIGAAIAQALIGEYRLALVFRENQDRAAKFKASFAAELQGNVEIFLGDISQKEICQRVYEQIQSWSQTSPAVFIHCAGVVRPSFFVTDPIETTLAVLDNNLHSTLLMSHHVLRDMCRKKEGKVILLGSVGSDVNTVGRSAYTISKASIETITQVLAREVYKRGIRVNCIRPGMVSTPMTENTIKGLGISEQKIIPAGHVVEGVRYLLSENASRISGTVLTIDHGMPFTE